MIEKLFEKLNKENQQELSLKIKRQEKLNEQEILKVLETLKTFNASKEILALLNQYEDAFPKQYYQLMQFRINALLDLKQYEEAKRKVLNELEMPYIPLDFEIFLKNCLKEIDFYLNEDKFTLQVKDLQRLDQLDDAHLLIILPQLKNFNLYPYLDKIQTLFLRQDIQDMTKSLLLATLSDLKIDYEFAVFKNNVQYLIHPIELKDLREYPSFQYLQNLIQQKANEFEMSDYTNFKQLIETYLLNLYPQDLSFKECDHLFYGTVKVFHELKKEQELLKDEYLNHLEKYSSEVEKYYQKVMDLLKSF